MVARPISTFSMSTSEPAMAPKRRNKLILLEYINLQLKPNRTTYHAYLL